jgi:hypothetical protein
MKQYEEVSEYSYKVDSWARQEIKALKDQLKSLPPPLEDVPIEPERHPHDLTHLQDLNAMKILTIQFQKYHVMIILEINT